MLENRKIISKENIKLIEKEYNIVIHHIEQQFLGADENTCTYKIESDKNVSYFLKIRSGEFIESSVMIPYVLSQKIGGHFIEPKKTIDSQLFIKKPEFAIILYPFIKGKSAKEIDLSKEQWIEFGRVMREIHNFALPLSNCTVEKFDSTWVVRLKKYMEELNKVQNNNRTIRQFVEMLVNRKNVIDEMILRAEELVRGIKQMEIDRCVCHADIHAANIFISEDDFYIVDWDTLLMAPKERDLMFIGAGVANKWNTKEESDLFYQGYGEHDKVNQTILNYYRYIRIIEDIVVYYDQFFAENVETKNRKSIIEVVNSAFWPGGVVEMAFKGDKRFIPVYSKTDRPLYTRYHR